MILLLEIINTILKDFYKYHKLGIILVIIPKYYNMKKYATIVMTLFTFLCLAQESKESFKGKIELELRTVFDNKNLYIEDVEKYLMIMDSIHTNEYLNDTKGQYSSEYPTLKDYKNSRMMLLKMVLNPNFSNRDKTKPHLYNYIFTDSTVILNSPQRSSLHFNRLEYKIESRSQYENPANLIYRFNEIPIDNIIIDENDTKIIAGIECYKVTIIQKGERIVRHFYWNNLKDSKVITEMYVTDKIKTQFNTIIKNKLILEKFYPMYVKRYSTAFRGIYLTSSIKKIVFEN